MKMGYYEFCKLLLRFLHVRWMILILIKIINNQRIRITRSNVKSSEDIKSYIYLAMTIFYLVIKIILKKIDLGISKTFVGFFQSLPK